MDSITKRMEHDGYKNFKNLATKLHLQCIPELNKPIYEPPVYTSPYFQSVFVGFPLKISPPSFFLRKWNIVSARGLESKDCWCKRYSGYTENPLHWLRG